MAEATSNADDAQAKEAKYKKLLALARSSLESNQASLVAKDKQIHQLTAALEEEKANNTLLKQKIKRVDFDDSSIPRTITRRIDVDHKIWILIEYEGGAPDAWMSFGNEDELQDFIQRIPGTPISVPARCLTQEESSKIETDAKVKVDRIVEEYRRYKVRVEIARKQKESDPKSYSPAPGIRGGGGSMDDSVNASLTASPPSSSASLQTLEHYDLEINKWKKAYEQVARENEQLRTPAGDSLLVKKWQERYEECMKEKEDLMSKLKVFSRINESTPNSKWTSNSVISGNHSPGTASFGSVSKGTLEQSYIDLKDEYKEYRRRVETQLAQRKSEIQDLKALIDNSGMKSLLMSSSSSKEHRALSSSTGSTSYTEGSHDGNGVGGNSGIQQVTFSDSKINYIRSMFLQYLSCKDDVVKPHIESALIAIFRYSDHEKLLIEESHKTDSQDPLSDTITVFTSLIGSSSNFLGTFTTA